MRTVDLIEKNISVKTSQLFIKKLFEDKKKHEIRMWSAINVRPLAIYVNNVCSIRTSISNKIIKYRFKLFLAQ
jgi:transcriptional regulator CtsR